MKKTTSLRHDSQARSNDVATQHSDTLDAKPSTIALRAAGKAVVKAGETALRAHMFSDRVHQALVMNAIYLLPRQRDSRIRQKRLLHSFFSSLL